MEAKIIRDGEFIEVRNIIIKLKNNDNEFRITEDNFGNLVLNKYGGEDSSIHITPSVSNEIRIN